MEAAVIFPSQIENIKKFHRHNSEINGLSKNSIPECEILDSFTRNREPDRVFYLIKHEHEVAIIRVCDAQTGSGYESFAVIHSHGSDVESVENTIALFNRWKSSILS